jgi:acyl carrier protein
MSEIDREKLIQAAVNWIRQNSSSVRSATTEITAQTPLLKDGILDSLGFVDLVAFLEKETGNQVDLLQLDEEELMTLNGLCRAISATGATMPRDGSANPQG